MDEPQRIAVAIDGFPEGLDAAALAAALARGNDAEALLVTVLNDPVVVPLSGMSWEELRRQAATNLAQTRDSLLPGARTSTITDVSVARGLERVVAREHRDVLVLGSSPDGPAGHVRIGKRTRQLIGDAACALAIAPRGLHHNSAWQINRIAVGWEGGPESAAALTLALAVARHTHAQLVVCSVVDDWMPLFGLMSERAARIQAEWRGLLAADVQAARTAAKNAVRGADVKVTVQVLTGHPANTLLELSTDVDLMIVGSRRWGFVARVVLGSTGEALVHDAACPLLIVPRLAERG